MGMADLNGWAERFRDAAFGALPVPEPEPVTRPALRYYGSKWRMAGWISKFFPAHTCYVEVFGGGANILLQKKAMNVDVYNDMDGDVVNFFKMLRDRTADLIRAVELTPYSRQELNMAYCPVEDGNEIERARRFYVRSWQGRGSPTGGRNAGWRFQRDKKRGTRQLDYWNNYDGLFQAAKRLKDVQIEQDWALNVIARYDTPQTLFYVDPPYVKATRTADWRAAYKFEMTDEDHRTLIECLKAVRGMVVLSGYTSDLYRNWLGDWERKVKRERTQNPDKKGMECLWLSPRTVEALGRRQLRMF